MATNENGMAYMPNCETYRQHAGLSQTQLSRDANVSRDTIAKVERRQLVKVELLNRIAEIFERKNQSFDRAREIRSTLAEPRGKKKPSSRHAPAQAVKPKPELGDSR